MAVPYSGFILAGCLLFTVSLSLYIYRINSFLKGVPAEVSKLQDKPWTSEQLRRCYRELEKNPLDLYANLPPKLDRRYIVTGGNGLVGGFIVLQLLARGTAPENIRILDIRKSQRDDLNTGRAAEVDFVTTDITSAESVRAAFDKPWPKSIQDLPLTVFHTAAVIVASTRSEHFYAFPERVNVGGTKNVLAASKASGADVFIYTSSASIPVRPISLPLPWARELRNYWQVFDESDFSSPMRPRSDFYGNYPISKAVAERLVCGENCHSFRTGCIRPANGVYGHPTDNTIGLSLSRAQIPTWTTHMVENFVHAANVAVAHLQQEAILVARGSEAPQAGRPFVVSDPNPPVTYGDLYGAVATLSVHPLRLVFLPPGPMFILSHFIEWYTLLPYWFPALRRILPELTGDLKHLQPGLFAVSTHLVGVDKEARKPVDEGGLGYTGLVNTFEGTVQEILEWNQDHQDEDRRPKEKKTYTASIVVADQIRQMLSVGGAGSADVVSRFDLRVANQTRGH